MRDVIGDISAWYARGLPFALATVVRTWRSSPRQPGAALAVSADGEGRRALAVATVLSGPAVPGRHLLVGTGRPLTELGLTIHR